jgi:hypothetical protein
MRAPIRSAVSQRPDHSAPAPASQPRRRPLAALGPSPNAIARAASERVATDGRERDAGRTSGTPLVPQCRRALSRGNVSSSSKRRAAPYESGLRCSGSIRRRRPTRAPQPRGRAFGLGSSPDGPQPVSRLALSARWFPPEKPTPCWPSTKVEENGVERARRGPVGFRRAGAPCGRLELVAARRPRMGGSHAQRHVFVRILAECAADRGDSGALARILVLRARLKRRDRFAGRLEARLESLARRRRRA